MTVFFAIQKPFSFMRSHLLIFVLVQMEFCSESLFLCNEFKAIPTFFSVRFSLSFLMCFLFASWWVLPSEGEGWEVGREGLYDCLEMVGRKGAEAVSGLLLSLGCDWGITVRRVWGWRSAASLFVSPAGVCNSPTCFPCWCLQLAYLFPLLVSAASLPVSLAGVSFSKF